MDQVLNDVEFEQEVIEGQDEDLGAEETLPETSPGQEEANLGEHGESGHGYQKRINELTGKIYEERNRAAALEAQLAAMQNGGNAQQQPNGYQQPVYPNNAPAQQLTPPTPPEDIYDDEAQAKYQRDMVKYSQDVAQQAVNQQISKYQQDQQMAQLKQQQSQAIQSYAERGANDGLTIEQMQHAEQTLNNARIDPSLGMFIMQDEHGAKIADYLANNPQEMHRVLSMHPMQAAGVIASDIKAKAVSAKRVRTTKAPEPAPAIKGGGHKEVDDFDRYFSDAQIL